MKQSIENLFYPIPLASFADAVAAVLVLDDGRYLMQLRDDKPGVIYPGHVGLFGGAVEPGENFEDAMSRELMEELDYRFEGLNYFTKMTKERDFLLIVFEKI